MNILVTGGVGFAGDFISRYLANLGCNIVATYRNDVPEEEVESIRYVRQDLSEEINIDEKIDVIVHTACLHPGKSIYMEDYIRDNVDSARQLVKFARVHDVKTIVYFSTKSIYGETKNTEIFEENDITNQDMYGLSKYMAEKVFQSAFDLNTIGFRVPGIIGQGAHDIWLQKIVQMMQNNIDVTISNIEAKNFVWIEDIAKFIYKLICEANCDKKFKYNIVNLACRESNNNIEIVENIKRRLNSKSKIIVNENTLSLGMLNANKAFEMGFESLTPLDIVNRYLDLVILEECGSGQCEK